MTWYELSKDLWEIIDQIADDLIGDAAWEEGDVTWDTSVKTGESARRVCRHIADDIYLSLIQCNTARRAGSQAMYGKGLIVVISDAWDGGAHEPTGNIQIVFVPFQADNSTPGADLADFEIDHKLFTSSSGFALVGVPPPNIDIYQSSFIVVVERNTNKIYADGYTNFYIFADGNYIHSYFYSYACGAALFGETVKWWRYTHALYLQSYADAYQKAYSAFKSTGDNKAYFMRPVLHNDTGERSPWLQPEFWVAVSSSKTNLADDDVLAMPAPSTKTYQVTLKQSPDSAVYMYYAIIKTE